MKKLGLSTGVLYKNINPFSKIAVEFCRLVGSTAIEICCVGGLAENDLTLDDLDLYQLADFDFVSMHAPSKKVFYDDNQISHEILTVLQNACDRLPITHVVFHPDTVKNWNIFNNYSFNIAIENMDNKRSYGINTIQLQEIFDNYDFGFVLDLNHCRSHDHSMRLADNLLAHFNDRLCEIHVSGYVNYHEMISLTNQKEILEYLPKYDVPIIIDSICNTIADVQMEYDYVAQYL